MEKRSSALHIEAAHGTQPRTPLKDSRKLCIALTCWKPTYAKLRMEFWCAIMTNRCWGLVESTKRSVTMITMICPTLKSRSLSISPTISVFQPTMKKFRAFRRSFKFSKEHQWTSNLKHQPKQRWKNLLVYLNNTIGNRSRSAELEAIKLRSSMRYVLQLPSLWTLRAFTELFSSTTQV